MLQCYTNKQGVFKIHEITNKVFKSLTGGKKYLPPKHQCEKKIAVQISISYENCQKKVSVLHITDPKILTRKGPLLSLVYIIETQA